MTTTVTITTTIDDTGTVDTVVVGDTAQRHVLRSFNPTESDETKRRVDATKVLCAALIQQMLDLRDANGLDNKTVLATERAIELIELAQMLCVKANFAQA